jgi:hypothetical protein
MKVCRPSWLLTVSACTLLSVAGCGRAPAPPQLAPASPAVAQSDRLFFGRSIPIGGTVTDSAWASFLAEVVTPRFPNGFTVWRSEGQWHGADSTIVHEAGFVLEVDHPPGQPPDSTFENIAEEYCRRFHQEAVLRLRAPVEKWLYRAVAR